MFGLTPYERWNKGLSTRRDFGDFDRMFNSMIEEFYKDMKFPASVFANDKEIKVDIKENDKEYLIEADLPGVDKDDIKLELRDDMLTISVEKKEAIDEEKENYIRKERKYGYMQRSFYVDNVDASKVSAKLENGVLCVTLPKKELGSSKNNEIPIE